MSEEERTRAGSAVPGPHLDAECHIVHGADVETIKTFVPVDTDALPVPEVVRLRRELARLRGEYAATGDPAILAAIAELCVAHL